MKKLLILILLIVLAGVFWAASGYWKFSKGDYFSNKALELSKPFDVKIDIELLRSLKPANE